MVVESEARAVVDSTEYSFTIDLPIRNEWQSVDLMRTSVQNCFAALFREVDGSHAVSMVTGELLENAMKYGNWGGHADVEQVFRLSIVGNSEGATVRVQSPVDPDGDNVHRLFETIEWINSHDDPEDAYRARLLAIASEREDAFNRLGLVRVAYEGGGKISADAADGVVTVTVRIDLQD